MDRLVLALGGTLLIVGVVVLGIVAVAWYGQRTALRGVPPMLLHRLGQIMIAIGILQVAVAVAYAVEFRDLGRAIWFLLQGGFHVVLGGTVVRQQQQTSR